MTGLEYAREHIEGHERRTVEGMDCVRCGDAIDSDSDPTAFCGECIFIVADAMAESLIESERISKLRGEEVVKWAHESGTAKGQRDKLLTLLDEATKLGRRQLYVDPVTQEEDLARLAEIRKEAGL